MADINRNSLSSTKVTKATTSQDLSAGVLDYTTSFTSDFRLVSIMFSMTGAATQTVRLDYDSSDGANYDTRLTQSAFTGQTWIFYTPPNSNQLFKVGDQIRARMTNTGTPAITVYMTIIVEEV